MFVGHYGVALAARGIEKRLPLWAYFLAVQWVDILWCVLVLLGVERVHVQQGVNPLTRTLVVRSPAACSPVPIDDFPEAVAGY
jgi:hypothetical protein